MANAHENGNVPFTKAPSGSRLVADWSHFGLKKRNLLMPSPLPERMSLRLLHSFLVVTDISPSIFILFDRRSQLFLRFFPLVLPVLLLLQSGKWETSLLPRLSHVLHRRSLEVTKHQPAGRHQPTLLTCTGIPEEIPQTQIIMLNSTCMDLLYKLPPHTPQVDGQGGASFLSGMNIYACLAKQADPL